MTTAGVVTAEYPMPAGTDSPNSITSGPDGNLWFTEGPGNAIGRITTSGVITEFPLPDTTRVFDITAGPDGNLWFPEFDNNKIGRITPAGEITEFPIPTADSGAYGITQGPDGNLWFTEFRNAQVGMLRPPAATTGARFYTLTPCRLVDTRGAGGPNGGPALVANTDRLFRLVGCGVPSSARSRGSQHHRHARQRRGLPDGLSGRRRHAGHLFHQLRGGTDSSQQRDSGARCEQLRLRAVHAVFGHRAIHPRRQRVFSIAGGSREQGAGSREQGAGSREQGAGSRINIYK